MTAQIQDGKLILTIDLITTPTPSKSGKTLLVATTHGNVATEATVDGKRVVISINAYIKP